MVPQTHIRELGLDGAVHATKEKNKLVMDGRYVDENGAESNYYVTLILRLVFDDERKLTRSELINTDGSLKKRFRDLDGLLDAIANLGNRPSI